MAHYTSGWDHFSPPPGKADVMHCRACDEIMEVTRNVNGPTGSAEAMGGGKHLHDSFACKNYAEKWHEQLIALLQLAQKTPSASLENIYMLEATTIKKTRKATKTSWGWY